MSRTLNIIFIDNSLGKTGAYQSLTEVSKHLPNDINKYLLIQCKTNLNDDANDKGFEVIEIPFLELSKSPKILLYLPRLLGNAIHLIRLVNKQSINVVHVNDLYNMLGVMVKLFYPKIKLVYHVRLLPDSYAGRIYPVWRFLIEKYADQIICVSEAVATNFSKPVKVIYDAIETPKWIEKSFEMQSIKLLFLANYTQGKGHELAIKAVSAALEKNPNLNLVMYGGSLGQQKNLNFKNHLIDMAAELNLESKIQINDFAEDITKVYQEADILLNFSNSESFSMTTLEALAYGTPAIVTDCGGPAEIIEDGVSGMLVPVGDIEAMTKAIIELANDPSLRERFSINGRKRFEEKFNIEKQAKKLEAVYNSLLPTGTSPPPHEAQVPAS